MKDNPQFDEKIREHTFDGIQEYDKKLPNWWLWTLWLSVVFAVGYWFWAHRWNIRPTQEQRYAQEYAKAHPEEAAAMEAKMLTDEELWALSKDMKLVMSGEKIFKSTCVSCHGADMKGGIGVNLVDADWKHGGKPTEIYNLVANGFLPKGMPAWGPQLGKKKVEQVVSFVLSKHSPDEPVKVVP